MAGGKTFIMIQNLKDKEHNSVIEKYLKENNIIISLVLKEDLDIESSHRNYYTIRNFLSYKKKIREINGKNFKEVNF